MAERKVIYKGNIGNALHSVAPDHITTTADEIFDEERQEYQQNINEGVGRYLENPEFIKVEVDNENRIIRAIKADGTEYLGAGLEVHGDIDTDGITVSMLENSEFAKVYLDNRERILYGIQRDGNFYFGAGVPNQIINYIESRIADLSLEEYEAIVRFLDGLEFDDDFKTLRELLDEKVDKEEGKSLINEEYSAGIQYIENPEFVEAKLDANGNILEATFKDGTKLLSANLKVKGDIDVPVATISSINSPEWLLVYTTNNNKILFGVKKDGSFDWSYGVPKPIKDYVQAKLDGFDDVTEIIDTVKEMSDFLEGYVRGDKLSDLLDKKVDGEYIENPEFIHIIKDSNENILEGTRTDGTKVFGGNVEVKGKQIIGGNEYSVVSSAEWIVAWLDATNKVIFGFKTNGKTFVGDADFLTAIKTNREAIDAIAMMIPDDIDWDALICMHTIDNPEYIAVETDSEDKILSGRNTDGSKFENFPIEFRDKVSIDGNIIRNIEDPKRVEIKTDSDDKIISYRDSEGVLHENVCLETPTLVTNSLNLTEQGMTEFQQALKDSGFKGGTGDWSEYLSNDGDNPLHISKPRRAIMNLIVDFNLVNLSKKGRNGAIQGVNYDIPTQIEFWDMQGNYFKKWALISGQGNSSMGYDKKNIAIDLFDSSVYNSQGKLGKGDVFSIKFGDWVPQDSFHLKANMSDTFRIVNQLSYSLYNDIVKTRGIRKDYMWKKSLIDFSSIGMTNVNKDVAEAAVDTGARCFPDGFPVIVYQNGEFWGIFHLSLKKHRDNFHMSKSNKKHIHLDGLLDDSTIFMANGNIDWARFTSHRCNWVGRLDGIEVRNPKDLYCVDVSYSYTALDATLDADEISKVIARHTYTNCTEDMTSATDAQIRETYGDNPPAYLLNTTSNVMYRIYETPTGTCDKYDADVNNHELIDDTMSCYDSTNKKHVTTNTVKHYIENFSRIMTIVDDAEQIYLNSEKTAQDLAALKEVFETYFDVENLIDYLIHGDITFNWDGFAGKNWQWFTYDGVKWYCGVYDCDLTFGKVGNIIAPIQGHTCQDGNSMPAHTLLMNRYILTYYETELNDRYKELRDKKVIDADRICSIISDMISIIGKDIYEAEWKKWSPEMPIDSIYRFQNWLSQNIAFKDTLYNYQ